VPDGRQPLDYDSIENSMRDVMNRLTVLTKEHDAACLAAAESEADFKGEFAISRTQFRDGAAGTKVTQDSAEDYATVETIEMRRQYLRDTAVKLAKKRALDTADGQLEALRSLMSSHRKALE
jgi:hypothetical protein